jgi:hypothetical protein
MKMLNEKELMFVNGGVGYDFSPSVSERNRERAEKQRQERVREQRRMESIADIRMRASEDALKAAMRLNKQEADIKEAMKAQREALGLN